MLECYFNIKLRKGLTVQSCTQPILDLINLFIGSNSGSEVIAVASQRMFRTFCYGVCVSQVFSGSCSFTHYKKKMLFLSILAESKSSTVEFPG